MKDHKTVAFLIIQRDTIKYERYLKGYDAAHVHPSFSMAKSVVSMLIGTAIQDGLIRDVQQPITDFIPELKKSGSQKVTIEHVLRMTSGIDFTERYVNPSFSRSTGMPVTIPTRKFSATLTRICGRSTRSKSPPSHRLFISDPMKFRVPGIM